MTRTHGAAIAAALVVGGSLVALGVFLGFPTGASVWFGLACGLLAGFLLVAANRRADTFHPTDPNAHLAEHPRGWPEDPGHLDADDRSEQHDPADRTDEPPAGDTRG
jgi:hypothetical protein